MENWGLVTYRETNLLYDPLLSASSNQQRVASVVAHELVHQVERGPRSKSTSFLKLASSTAVIKVWMSTEK